LFQYNPTPFGRILQILGLPALIALVAAEFVAAAAVLASTAAAGVLLLLLLEKK
jgi:hypothetical protein